MEKTSKSKTTGLPIKQKRKRKIKDYGKVKPIAPAPFRPPPQKTPGQAVQQFKALRAGAQKARLGTKIEQNRSLGFGSRQSVESIEGQLSGPARESQVGAQSVSLGMGRTGGFSRGLLAKKASTSNLASKPAETSLRVKGATLPRHKVN